MRRLRLGVNIDHVATLRNARGGPDPDPLRAAHIAGSAGADGITAHLREDRRHIRDDDVEALVRTLTIPLNLEMAATDEMVAIALRYRPYACCIVPERREERTTEGGLDAAGQHRRLAPMVRALSEAGIRVSLFIAPEPPQWRAACSLSAPVVELHTGAYSEAVLMGDAAATNAHLHALQRAARDAGEVGLEVHAGHGLTYDNVGPVAAIPELQELNIGHFLIGEGLFTGLAEAIHGMRTRMDAGRAAPA